MKDFLLADNVTISKTLVCGSSLARLYSSARFGKMIYRCQYVKIVMPQILNEPAVQFAQGLSTKSVYTMKEAMTIAGSSRRTAYRRLQALKSLGIAKSNRGRFIINTVVSSQPAAVLHRLLPSLQSLNQARRFGKSYNQSDINFIMNNTQDKIITLDYRAWDLTKFQYPMDLYIYVKDIARIASYLKQNGFSEGQRGHIVLLPEIGDFSNEIERVYLDCIAKGGRSMLDAIAIELLYSDQISVKGRFTTQDVIKVREDLPIRQTQ